MSHYERRLSEDLEAIRNAIDLVGKDVASGLERCVRAVRTEDRDMLYQIAVDDLAINRQIREIDELCHAFVARHLPAARHLRFISSVLRLTIALERAGDYAVTISRVVLQLENALSDDLVKQIGDMAEMAWAMLADAVRAFLEADVELARATKRVGKRIDRQYDERFQDLIEGATQRPALQQASLLKIFGKIERFSDQAKNICDEAMFVATGELKAPRVFRILFLDERNDLVSQLAAGLAAKQFPDHGVYSSAGWAAAESHDGDLAAVADRFALTVTRPRLITELAESPVEYHLVVAINVPSEHLPRIPYHTILLRWDDITVPPANLPPEARAEALDALVRELSANLSSLMERLRGTEPD
ncbi:Phosphate transport system regulatory protein PhoU [Enhygromyxa salina]|uniref:Phosphate transport system regulatory protein PhoU n=1 Tax=Enhygromyxa salina TaxID=215803 RepID=A0A0C2DAC1_9BACT|nr:PhoU domain-containing protein [Enhygromyxa salina]KIG18475.1 Phosphate transport system regulatory protein PhoU [Enhygromyxa salina]